MILYDVTTMMFFASAIFGGATYASAFVAYHPHTKTMQPFSNLHRNEVNQIPPPFTTTSSTATISIQKNSPTTQMSMAGARKKLSEMTEEEKIAEKEKGDLLLKAKGAAFVVAALAFYLSQQ